MRYALASSLVFFAVLTTPARATEVTGPARFCGYSTIIDLEAGEKVRIVDAGIHAGRFLWLGSFGALEVRNIGWAKRPAGRIVRKSTQAKPARFQQTKSRDVYSVALWNGRQGVAYITSSTRFTTNQIEAIDRVKLYQEGEPPQNCTMRTVFIWE
ncbi:MAG: hypothetical protein RL145_2325 [Pseudomonadota bacterium]|jgi:hypothetical protein